MFLSTRWGKPSYEIDLLPTSEFLQQKLFWERYKWGLGNDLLALIMSQVLGIRTHSKPASDPFQWKDLALLNCGRKIKTMATSNASSIRRGFMSIWNALKPPKGKDKNGK